MIITGRVAHCQSYQKKTQLKSLPSAVVHFNLKYRFANFKAFINTSYFFNTNLDYAVISQENDTRMLTP